MKTTETRNLVSPPIFPHRIDQPLRTGEKPPVLAFDGLVKRYGRTIAVDNLSLKLQRGEVFGFLGPNGAGKTSTIRMLCGLTRPSAGSGTVLGFDIWTERFEIRSHLGLF